MAVELSIVIVNWNGGAFLRAAIESVVESPPGVPFDIIVVDNASTDSSLDWLRSTEAKERLGATALRLVENTENVGFSKANNQAFALSDAPLLFLLNADAEVRAGTLDKAIATLKSDGRNGACGPRLVNPDGSLQPSVFRNPPAPWEILLAGFRLHGLLPANLRGRLLLGGHWNHAERRRVERLSGAAMLVRREVIDAVGGLDERFHMYGEDVEWCLRIRRGGWWLIHEPDAVVMHHGGQSSKQRWGGLETARRIVDGQLRFQERCLSRTHFVSNIMASSAVAGVSYAWRTLRGAPAVEARMALSLYAKYLKRALRAKGTGEEGKRGKG